MNSYCDSILVRSYEDVEIVTRESDFIGELRNLQRQHIYGKFAELNFLEDDEVDELFEFQSDLHRIDRQREAMLTTRPEFALSYDMQHYAATVELAQKIFERFGPKLGLKLNRED